MTVVADSGKADYLYSPSCREGKFPATGLPVLRSSPKHKGLQSMKEGRGPRALAELRLSPSAFLLFVRCDTELSSSGA